MFGHFLIDWIAHQFDRLGEHWGPGHTTGLGLGFIISADSAGKMLGMLALLVGICCSIRREMRETAAARRLAREHRAKMVDVVICG